MFWEKHKILKVRNDMLPDDQKMSRDELVHEADKATVEHLLKVYGKSKLRAVAIFLLKISDSTYECAGFRELFKDIVSNNKRFERGFLKPDTSALLAGAQRNYIDILQGFIRGFFGTRSLGPQCHQESMIKVFGRRISDPFWYLRYFLYCDEFIDEHYFFSKYSDSSPLYRLESIAMVSEQIDLEFRYPGKSSVVTRTKDQSAAHKQAHRDSLHVYNVRLELQDSLCPGHSG